MNILIFSWRGPGHPEAGGAEISTHEHAKGWVGAGHNVTLFTSYYHGAKRKEEINGVTIIREGNQALGVQWKAFWWYLFGNHLKFDLVIDQFHGIPFFTPLYVKVRKMAFIHEVAKEVWGLNPWPWPFNLAPKILGSFFEPVIFQLFYRNIPFMTVSKSTKKDLVNWGIPEKNVTVIHNGLNLLPINNYITKEKVKTLMFLGALTKDKGIEDVLRIFSLLDTADKNFHFWIVGKGNAKYLETLKRETSKLGIGTKIKFWGFVTEKKKYELLGKAHILINPSFREGWGLVVIEAAAMGTPAAAYDVQGLRDSIKHLKTGILGMDRTPQQLSLQISALLDDKKRYWQMCQEAKIWSQKFSWKKSTEESLKLINKISKENY